MTNEHTTELVRTQVEIIYRTEARRLFATLVRLLGDFDLTKDGLHDAFRRDLDFQNQRVRCRFWAPPNDYKV